jgi:hypothetical protein
MAAAAVAGAAYATIPDGGGVIHGCYQKSGGSLRVIDASVTGCSSKETSLNWNVQGLQGPAGVQGQQGAQGPAGPPGPAGATMVWSESAYPSFPANDVSKVGAEIAHLTFTSPAAGFVVVTANWAMRIHNNTNGVDDCRVQTQIAPAAGVPDDTGPGFADQLINGNLPTELDGGTYLGLNASATRVLPAVAGSNTVYLNAKTNCLAALLGPATVTAMLVQSNPSASLVIP